MARTRILTLVLVLVEVVETTGVEGRASSDDTGRQRRVRSREQVERLTRERCSLWRGGTRKGKNCSSATCSWRVDARKSSSIETKLTHPDR